MAVTRDVSFDGNQMVVLVSADETHGALSLLEETVPAGWSPPAHVHHRATELLYVLEGSYTFEVHGDRTMARAGSHVVVPAGTPHTWQSGPDGGRMLIVFAPGGMEAYFAELSEGSNEAQPDRLGRSRRYGMEIIPD